MLPLKIFLAALVSAALAKPGNKTGLTTETSRTLNISFAPLTAPLHVKSILANLKQNIIEQSGEKQPQKVAEQVEPSETSQKLPALPKVEKIKDIFLNFPVQHQLFPLALLPSSNVSLQFLGLESVVNYEVNSNAKSPHGQRIVGSLTTETSQTLNISFAPLTAPLYVKSILANLKQNIIEQSGEKQPQKVADQVEPSETSQKLPALHKVEKIKVPNTKINPLTSPLKTASASSGERQRRRVTKSSPTSSTASLATTEVAATTEKIQEKIEATAIPEKVEQQKIKPRSRSSQELPRSRLSKPERSSATRKIYPTYDGPKHVLERMLKKAQRGATSTSKATTTPVTTTGVTTTSTTTTTTTTTTSTTTTTETPTIAQRSKPDQSAAASSRVYRQPRIITKVLQDNRNSREEKRDYIQEISILYPTASPITKQFIQEVLSRKVSAVTEREYLRQHLHLLKPETRNLFVQQGSQQAEDDEEQNRFYDLSEKDAQKTAMFIVLMNDLKHPSRSNERSITKRRPVTASPYWKY